MSTPTPPQAPESEEALIAAMAREYPGLSRQLKQIGTYVEQHRAQLGIQSIQQVAEQCEVQPSAVVRFAKHFGFSGFTEMQKLFRDGLAKQISPSRDYQSRIRGAIESGANDLSSADIVNAVIGGSIAGMQELQRSLQEPAFDAAVDLLFRADAVWLMASRRSFAISTYLTYALQHTEKRVQQITAMGSMQDGQLRGLRRGDVMVAISFAPYAPETEHIVSEAHARGASIICITDSSLSPMARYAHTSILVNETSVFGFRALTNTMAVVQSLFMALAYRLELQYQPARPRPSHP
jgi:DNA-binding MurR/RpiR family transcriptional regulator